MVERSAKIRPGIVLDQTSNTLEPIILENVAARTTISSDMHGAYKDLVRTSNHGAVGTHVHISKKHAWKYVSEFNYRRKYRHSHWLMFHRLVAPLFRCRV
jgi:transposase